MDRLRRYVWSSDGNVRDRTSCAYERAASPIRVARSSYRFTKRGVRSNIPSMSSITRTWPSQSADAPIPIIGGAMVRATSVAITVDHSFDDNAEGARFRDSLCVRDDLFRLSLFTTTSAITTEHIDGLRSEPDMSDHRNSAVRQKIDCWCKWLAPQA